MWGSAVPVDPGAHTVTATATGHKAWEMKIAVSEAGTTSTVKVPALEQQTTAAVTPVVAPTAGPIALRAERGTGGRVRAW